MRHLVERDAREGVHLGAREGVQGSAVDIAGASTRPRGVAEVDFLATVESVGECVG